MKKILMINGCFAGGKSSVVKEIAQQKDLFIISFDTIKKFFTKYDRTVHKEHVIAIMLRTQGQIMSSNYTIVFDGILLGEIRDLIKEEAQKYNYETIEFNIEASLETSLTRFRQRLIELGEQGMTTIKNSKENTSEEHFIERYNFYQEKKKSVDTFSSDELTSKEIADQIIKVTNI